MAYPSPILGMHRDADALLLPWGPPERDILVPAVFDHIELEYAALRKHAALLDLPHRAVIEARGPDRLPFLDRMVTQSLKDFQPFRTRRAFWLNRKGRIDADLRLLNLPDRLLLDTDALVAPAAAASLAAFIITDEVTLDDRSHALHRLVLHGPLALDALASAARLPAPPPLEPDHAAVFSIAGHECIVDRDDSAGVIGLELTLPAAAAEIVCTSLLAHPGVRPIGWHAYNIARIEAGRPLFNLDFASDSLPHETGLLADRVSFTKGCYLGQEVVARMHSRGHSKRRLVALLLEPQTPALAREGDLVTPQPETGASIFAGPLDDPGESVGAVTSSAISPMLGSRPIAFASVKPGHESPGTRLLVACGEALVPAAVRETLRFLPD